MTATTTRATRTEVIETQLLHDLLRAVDAALLWNEMPNDLTLQMHRQELWEAKEAIQAARLRRIAAAK
jgi:hypothetical protein